MAARLIRGPERHDSASLRVTTAPYVMLARASGEFAGGRVLSSGYERGSAVAQADGGSRRPSSMERIGLEDGARQPARRVADALERVRLQPRSSRSGSVDAAAAAKMAVATVLVLVDVIVVGSGGGDDDDEREGACK